MEVATDLLLSDDNTNDKDLLKKFEAILEMKGDTKNTILNLLDLAIRDYKAKQAFKIQNI